jgi:DedD protein
VDDPRTHYQISITSRQAVALFVVLLAGLVGSYFLGLLTGLSGRDTRPAAAIASAATPSPEASFPAPVLGVRVRGSSSAKATEDKAAGRAAATPAGKPAEEAPAAAATPAVQLFQDRPSSEPTRAPVATARPSISARASSSPGEASGFWVQVDSLSSKDQAEARRRGLAQAGFKAAIVPGTGPKGAVYRVRVGPYSTREEADRARSDLARKAKVKPWVVPPGQ